MLSTTSIVAPLSAVHAYKALDVPDSGIFDKQAAANCCINAYLVLPVEMHDFGALDIEIHSILEHNMSQVHVLSAYKPPSPLCLSLGQPKFQK